jgi:hypothetical protein
MAVQGMTPSVTDNARLEQTVNISGSDLRLGEVEGATKR